MEKEHLIRILLADEPPYQALSKTNIPITLLVDILNEGSEDLKTRVISLSVLLPDVNPLELIYEAYINGGVAVQAVSIASLSRVNQEYLFEPKMLELMSEAIQSKHLSVQKFALQIAQRRNLKYLAPLIKSQLEKTSEKYLQNLMNETLQTL